MGEVVQLHDTASSARPYFRVGDKPFEFLHLAEEYAKVTGNKWIFYVPAKVAELSRAFIKATT